MLEMYHLAAQASTFQSPISNSYIYPNDLRIQYLVASPEISRKYGSGARFGASPCSGPVHGHLRRRGLGQTAKNKVTQGDV